MVKHYSKKNKKMDMNYFLRSRNVLYVVLLFAIANLFSYLMMKQLDAVAFFIIIGFLTSYFSKNMIIIMLTSMVSTFALVQINILGKVQEGMTTEGDNKLKTPEEHANSKATGNSNGTNENAPSDPISTSEIPMTEEDRTKLTSIKDPLQKKHTDGFKTSNKEKFSQKLTPARYNNNNDDVSFGGEKPEIDYSATLETAYDNLDKLLNSKAMKNMSEDTNRLAEKQQLLMGNIEKMEPIMQKAGSLLENMDMTKIEGMIKGLDKFGIAGKLGLPTSSAGKASVDLSE